MSELRAGWSKREITPECGYAMAGYIARRGTSAGVLDPLYVRVLLIEEDATRMVLVIADVLLISSAWAARLRRTISKALNTRPEFVIVAATHTHSGPMVNMRPFHFSGAKREPNLRQYSRKLEEAMLTASVEASQRVRAVKVSFKKIEVEGVASDRNRPRRARRQDFFVFKFSASDGDALLGIYGCHPTILGADNRSFSGDLHGAISRIWETKASIALVANGAAANISTRFRRTEQTAAELMRFASKIVRQASIARFKRITFSQMRAYAQIVNLPLRDLKKIPPGNHSQSSRRAVVAAEAREVRVQLARAKEFSKPALRLAVCLWRLGPISFAALPLEIYSDTGELLWKSAHVIPICYANGYWGYLPSAAAAPDDYEALSSPFTSAGEPVLRQSITSMVK